jgi:hypothetical protein
VAATDVEICNSALAKIGAARIVALSDNTEQARLCNQQYSLLRDEVLRSHPWNFAIKRAALTADVTTPTFRWTSNFILPADYLRVLEIENEDLLQKWAIEGDFLVADQTDPINIVYIAQITDVTKFDTNFSEVLAWRIAADLAYPLSQSRTLADDVFGRFREALILARNFDAQEGSVIQVGASEWLTGRF